MDHLKHHEIPGHVTVFAGKGDLPAIRINTQWSTAEIYLHGAQVTRFEKVHEADFLFLSSASEFREGTAIRGGVPLIFPWFGALEGFPAHGALRTVTWELLESESLPDDTVRVSFRLTSEEDCQVDFIVTVGESLAMELIVTNSGDDEFTFENCLHTYFNVRSITRSTLTGLTGTRYFDKLLGTEVIDTAEPLRIHAETDRIYQDTAAAVEIHDSEMRRTIRVRKSGSKSTVIWNPWIEKSKRMPDFGDMEYLNMVCVESGNLCQNSVTLPPGEKHTLKVEIDSIPLE